MASVFGFKPAAYKTLVKRNPTLFLFSLLIFRPQRFWNEIIISGVEMVISIFGIKKRLRSIPKAVDVKSDQKKLLCFFGNYMELHWVQLWVFLSKTLQKRATNNLQLIAVTSRLNIVINIFARLMGFKLIFLENIYFESKFEGQLPSNNLESWKNFYVGSFPFGKMVLSTYCRQRVTGRVDFSQMSTQGELVDTLHNLHSWLQVFEKIVDFRDVDTAFFTEVFMEEFGPAYYVLLGRNVNIIRFNGSVRDDHFIAKRMTWESDRKHFNSLENSFWNSIKHRALNENESQKLTKNFDDRYGERWGLSARNQRNTRFVENESMRRELGIELDAPVGIIYSHILYDALFFNGEYLFDSYADWIVKTIENIEPKSPARWFLKIHPSNIWRGELETFLNNKYEEIRVIEEQLGKVPEHVTVIPADTSYDPRSWLDVCDVGVTCTGTSGVELGILGKSVISAGTGRYENAGFAHHPSTKHEYYNLINNLEEAIEINESRRRQGRLFGFLNFCVKPTRLDGLGARLIIGRSTIKRNTDLVYKFNEEVNEEMTPIFEFCEWIIDSNCLDFIDKRKFNPVSDYH